MLGKREKSGPERRLCKWRDWGTEEEMRGYMPETYRNRRGKTMRGRSWASLRYDCGTVTLAGNTTGSLGDKLDEGYSTSGSLEGWRYSYSCDGSLLLRAAQGGTVTLEGPPLGFPVPLSTEKSPSPVQSAFAGWSLQF